MKKLIIIACLITGTITAQTPTPSPALPTPAPAGMTLPPQSQAALIAGQIISQVTGLLNNVIQVIDNGMPAQQNQPGVAAKDIQAALGNENVMKFRSAVALLSAAAPTPTATPTK